jgi:hypothetical protein
MGCTCVLNREMWRKSAKTFGNGGNGRIGGGHVGGAAIQMNERHDGVDIFGPRLINLDCVHTACWRMGAMIIWVADRRQGDLSRVWKLYKLM